MRIPALVMAVLGGFLGLLSGRVEAAEKIPFQYRDGLIWVKVTTAASTTPLNFLLDSGAGATVLNLDTARKLGVNLGKREKVNRVGASAAAWRVKGFNATVAGIAVSQTPLALDLSDTSALCSRRIDGLLGVDFFHDRILEIDYDALCLRVLDRVNERGLCAVMPLRMENNAMLVPVSVNGAVAQWTRLDTGCDEGLHWVAGLGGGYASTSVQLGGMRIAKVKTALHDAPIFPKEAGLLGNEVLSNYRVTFDRVNGRLLLARA